MMYDLLHITYDKVAVRLAWYSWYITPVPVWTVETRDYAP